MSERLFPEPTITAETKPFWDKAAEGQFYLQQCDDCEKWVFYPRSHCPHCLGASLTWREASGTGKLKSWSVVHRTAHPAWQARAPYVVGVVELTEGPSMLTHLVINEQDLAYQLPVEVTFQRLNDRLLPFFQKKGEKA